MRVLVVGYEYEPRSNPRARRWSAIARHWAERGHEVDVVCGVPGEDNGGNGPVVHRVAGGLGDRLRARFGRSAKPASGGTGSGPRRSRLGWVYRLHDLVVKPFQWPDYAHGWRRPATRAVLDLLAKRPDYDALVSVSNPFTSHRVAIGVRERFPGLRWIADIGDPLAIGDSLPMNNERLFRAANRRLERTVVEAADVVTIVTDSMTRLYRESYPRANVVSVPVLANSGEPIDRPGPPPGPRKLAFLGSLYPGLRSPAGWLRVFAEIARTPGFEDVEAHFYGIRGATDVEFEPYRELLDRRVFLHEPVPGDAVPGVMRECTALVNIANRIEFGLPSKVVEYVATGLPVINVTPTGGGPSAPFLQRYPAAINVVTDGPRRTDLAEILRFLQHPPVVDRATVDRIVAPHRTRAVAAAYEAAILGRDGELRRAA